jgi:hypothetical protein
VLRDRLREREKEMRLDLDKHLLECPLRIEKCAHCHIDVVVTQLARHHLLACPKFPVNCQVCGGGEILRENINAHMSIVGDCPMVIVPCSYRAIGCWHEDHRCKMAKHYQDAANTHHLTLMSTRQVALETKHRVDMEEFQRKYERTIELTQRLEMCEKRNDELREELTMLEQLNNSHGHDDDAAKFNSFRTLYDT